MRHRDCAYLAVDPCCRQSAMQTGRVDVGQFGLALPATAMARHFTLHLQPAPGHAGTERLKNPLVGLVAEGGFHTFQWQSLLIPGAAQGVGPFALRLPGGLHGLHRPVFCHHRPHIQLAREQGFWGTRPQGGQINAYKRRTGAGNRLGLKRQDACHNRGLRLRLLERLDRGRGRCQRRRYTWLQSGLQRQLGVGTRQLALRRCTHSQCKRLRAARHRGGQPTLYAHIERQGGGGGQNQLCLVVSL